MGKKQTTIQMTSINSLEDLINVNLRTLENVVNETDDNRKAAVIFTGSRTITGILKLGLEATKAGLVQIGGVRLGYDPEKKLVEGGKK